jgi:hypothetical protein
MSFAIKPANTAVASDAAGVMVDPVAAAVNAAASAGGQGNKAVTNAGTPLQLAAATACRAVVITARIGNTKEVAIGFSNAVRATAGSELGMCLQPGTSVAIAVSDLSLIWVDAQVNGEGVSFTYIT